MITTTILWIIILLLILLIIYEIVYIFIGYRKKDNKSDINSVGNSEKVHIEQFKPRNEIKPDEVTNNFEPYNGQISTHMTIKTPLPSTQQAKIKSKGPAIVVTSPQF